LGEGFCQPRTGEPLVLCILTATLVPVSLPSSRVRRRDVRSTSTHCSRNHYTRRRYWVDGPRKDQLRKDGKLFQEPYAYQKYYDDNKDKFQGREAVMYRAVLPVCRYYIRLRYSLMQLLYDAMFENMITGLPIARAMVGLSLKSPKPQDSNPAIR
jgi:hypothetical protein